MLIYVELLAVAIESPAVRHCFDGRPEPRKIAKLRDGFVERRPVASVILKAIEANVILETVNEIGHLLASFLLTVSTPFSQC